MRNLFLLTIVAFIAFAPAKSFAASDAEFEGDFLENLHVSLRVGAAKQSVFIRTTIANSILDWNSDTLDFGTDIRYFFTPKIFTELEYTYSQTKGGSASDDDVENGLGLYSRHGVAGRFNDIKLSTGYEFYKSGSLGISVVGGAFFKEAEVNTKYGVLNYGSGVDNLENGNQTNSKYMGLLAGGEIRSKLSKDVKFSFRADYLLPLKYKAENLWYGRTPTLYWTMQNSKDSGQGDFGVRLKSELGFKTGSTFIDYVKLYAFYEYIEFEGLIESEANYDDVDGRVCTNCLSVGEAKFEAFGGGVSLEF